MLSTLESVYKKYKKFREENVYTYWPIIYSKTDAVVKTDFSPNTITFATCDYLSLSNRSDMAEASKNAIDKYGTNVCSAICFAGYTDLHAQLEEKLGDLFGKSALLFPTSYLANIGTIPSIIDKDGVIFFDRCNHISLMHGSQLSGAKIHVFSHNDMGSLERKLSQHPLEQSKLIVVDGIYSADGDLAPLHGILALAKKYNAKTLVDEAHAFGVIGNEKLIGVSEKLGLIPEIDYIVGTFSKAMGSHGGFLIALKDQIDFIRHVSGPHHSSRTIPPAAVAACLKALSILETEGLTLRKKLYELCHYAIQKLKSSNFNTLEAKDHIIPIVFEDEQTTAELAKFLQNNGVLSALYVSPTVPKKSPRLRIGLTVNHTHAHIDRLIELMKLYFESKKNRITEKKAA